MAKRDHLIQPVSSPSAQSPPPIVNSRQLTRGCPKICSPRHFCLPSKPVILIYLWSSVVGAIFAVAFDIVIALGVSAQHHQKRDMLLLTIVCPYAIITLVLLLYPVSGFVADVCCGRFKTITFSLFLLWCAFVPLAIVSVLLFLEVDHDHKHAGAGFALLGVIAFVLITTALAGYQANIIQLGLDQLHEAPCQYLGLFVHWNGWSGILGAFFCHLIFLMYAFYNDDGIPIKVVESLPWAFLLILSVLLVFSCYNHQWFYSEPGQHNPYKTVFKVLSFAKKHKHPIRCSAFTYCEDERPSRIDFAKSKYGGPFETDKVEDVKTFLRILCLLFSLGPVFVLEVPVSPFLFIVFGLHISVGKHAALQLHHHKHTHNSSLWRWILLESGFLQQILAVVVLPVYIWIVYSVLYRKVPRILTRIKIAVVLFLIGVLSMAIIDIIGHSMAPHDSKHRSSNCMLIAESDNFDFSPLNMTHWALVPPNVFLGIAPVLLDITVFEFISAQSPHSMKGLLIGMFFAIKGLFQFIGAVTLVPFALPRIWDHTTSVPNCGFGYLLFTSVVASIGFIVFLITARSYQYRQRDEKPYDHQYVEHYYKRYARASRIQVRLSEEESTPISSTSEGLEPSVRVTARSSCNNYGAVQHTNSLNDPSLSFDWD